MKLIEDWQQVLKRAWSIRLLILAGVFDLLERALPLMDQTLVSPGVFQGLSLFVMVGAGLARILKQPEVPNAGQTPTDGK